MYVLSAWALKCITQKNDLKKKIKIKFSIAYTYECREIENF